MSQFPGHPKLSHAGEPALQAGFSERSEHFAYRPVTLYTNYTGAHGTEEMQTTLGMSQGVLGDNSHRISHHSPTGEGTTERSNIPTLLPNSQNVLTYPGSSHQSWECIRQFLYYFMSVNN